MRYTNAHWLVMRNPGGADDGLFARDAEGQPLCWDRAASDAEGRARCARRDRHLAGGGRRLHARRRPQPRYRRSSCSPSATSIRSTRPTPSANAAAFPPRRSRRIARELADAAFDSNLRLPIAWTDA